MKRIVIGPGIIKDIDYLELGDLYLNDAPDVLMASHKKFYGLGGKKIKLIVEVQ